MMRLRKGAKASCDGVLFTTEEYKNYLQVIDRIQDVILETRGGMKRKNW